MTYLGRLQKIRRPKGPKALFIKRLLVVGLASFTFHLTSATGWTQSLPDCDKALVQDGLSFSGSQFDKLTYLYLMDKETYEQKKKTATSELQDWFSSSYNEFQSKLSRYFNTINFQVESQKMLDYARYYLSDNALQAYSKCIEENAKKRDGSLHVWFTDVGKELAVGQIYWNDAPGDNSNLPLSVLTAGVVPTSWPSEILPDQTVPFLLTRLEGKPMALVVKAGAYGASETVPAYFKVTPKRSARVRDSAIGKADCKRGGSDDGQVCVAPSTGWAFLPETASVQVTKNVAFAEARGATTNPHEKQKATITERSPERVCMKLVCYPRTRKGSLLKAYISTIEERWEFIEE